MNTKQQTEGGGGLDEIAIGLPEDGVPMPRVEGFLGRLRRTLERLEVGMSVELLNVPIKREKYIRQRMPTLGKELGAKYSVRVSSHVRDRSTKRSLRVWRTE